MVDLEVCVMSRRWHPFTESIGDALTRRKKRQRTDKRSKTWFNFEFESEEPRESKNAKGRIESFETASFRLLASLLPGGGLGFPKRGRTIIVDHMWQLHAAARWSPLPLMLQHNSRSDHFPLTSKVRCLFSVWWRKRLQLLLLLLLLDLLLLMRLRF